MKQTIIRLFSLLLLGMVAGGAQAGAVYYKKYDVSLNATGPTGAGKVYITIDDNERTMKDKETGNEMQMDNYGYLIQPLTDSVEVIASINKNDNNEYICKLWGFPEPGYKLKGFQKKGESTIIDPISVVGGNTVVLEKVDSPTDKSKEDAQKGDSIPCNYYAIFDTTDEYVTKDFFYKSLAGYQNNSYGTIGSEKISDDKIRLTADPGDRMRLVGWRITTEYKYTRDNVEAYCGDIVSYESPFEVDNTLANSGVYRPEFDLEKFSMPADFNVRTYCHKMGPRFDVQDPKVAEAYKVTGVDNGELVLQPIKHIGPTEDGGHGVILKAPKGSEITLSYGYLNFGTAAEDNKDNLLQGAEDADVVSDGTLLVLANGSQGLGFYRLKSGEKVEKGKAYLKQSDISTSRDFIGFANDETTSITSTTDTSMSTPIIYNMAGQRVNGSYSGLVIQNGRKFIRK